MQRQTQLAAKGEIDWGLGLDVEKAKRLKFSTLQRGEGRGDQEEETHQEISGEWGGGGKYAA
jgi:hypothetical protein